MQTTRQLLRAAGQAVVPGSAGSVQAIPAPNYFLPASKAPSPAVHFLIATGIGLSFALTYKMYYWNWKKELNQFNYDYNKTMAELAEQATVDKAAAGKPPDAAGGAGEGVRDQQFYDAQAEDKTIKEELFHDAGK